MLYLITFGTFSVLNFLGGLKLYRTWNKIYSNFFRFFSSSNVAIVRTHCLDYPDNYHIDFIINANAYENVRRERSEYLIPFAR